MDLKAKLSSARQKLPPLLRRTSKESTATLANRTLHSSAGSARRLSSQHQARKSTSMTKLPLVSSSSAHSDDADSIRLSQSDVLPAKGAGGSIASIAKNRPDKAEDQVGSSSSPSRRDLRHAPPPATTTNTTTTTTTTTPSTSTSTSTSTTTTAPSNAPPLAPPQQQPSRSECPAVTIQQATPTSAPADPPADLAKKPSPAAHPPSPQPPLLPLPRPLQPSDPSPSSARSPPPAAAAPAASSSQPVPPGILRRQSLVSGSDARVIRNLLGPADKPLLPSGPATAADGYFASQPLATSSFNAGMLHRKIWVKRPNASATLVQIREDDLVDDVRDMILRKYANSLGKAFDSPDLTLRIHARDGDDQHKPADRILGPEEDMCRTLDAYFPGGQTVNDALIIDVPHRKTPKPSPRVPLYYAHHDDSRPYEAASEYFPQMPIVQPSPAAMTAASHETRASLPHAPHSIAVLQSGQLPPLPSPGSSRRAHPHARPKYPRHNTASPTALTGGAPVAPGGTRAPQPRQRQDSTASDAKHSTSSGAHPIPTPPPPAESIIRHESNPPTPRIASPRPEKKRKKQKNGVEPPALPAGLLDNSVPPINVLIVEDNIINLRVLGAFMQRLKVRWQRAMNGKEAVTKWRAGGFHLVLMDIQLPIMNGLEATKEIRRLERVNGIGVFSSGSSEAPNNRLGENENGTKSGDLLDDDKLGDKSLFKSPVIIVALTASSLQSDRHEALAAGCNDFLTKPVNFVWLERKVKEWGCMQALIDFDGWRKWKDFAVANPGDKNEKSDSRTRASSGFASYAARPEPPAISATSPPASTSNSNPDSVSAPTATNGASTADVSSPQEAPTQKKSNRRSLGIVRQPSLPEEDSQENKEDLVDGTPS